MSCYKFHLYYEHTEDDRRGFSCTPSGYNYRRRREFLINLPEDIVVDFDNCGVFTPVSKFKH